jgi:iron complex transport system ATP-binding protein
MKLAARNLMVEVEAKSGAGRIVDDVSIEARPGELLGLIGPNGAGKSSLLRAIVGARPRTAGEVLLDGADAFALEPRARARALSYLPQERGVEWRLPVWDVVMLGRYPHQPAFGGPTEESRRAVDAALEAVDAAALSHRVVSTLSGGERARVLLARALAVEAPVLLADEPIAALDPYHQLHVMEILRDQARAGRAVLAVLHDLALAARFMDRIVLMHQGRVVGEGPPGEVLTREALAEVYQISAVDGEHEGARWLLPWSRVEP